MSERFAGRYFDYLGGDPSDPENFYKREGAVVNDRIDRPVPVGRSSFMQPIAPMDVPEGLMPSEIADEELTDEERAQREQLRNEFLAAALAELTYIEPNTFMGGNVGMVDNEATRALDELTRGFYS
jgi:DNA-directed RNA polymerase specialized sigma24 family protein|tara:strand:+ start:25 stop:402 length:378 start_codon:yes stop_codon:yes gene_type:complete